MKKTYVAAILIAVLLGCGIGALLHSPWLGQRPAVMNDVVVLQHIRRVAKLATVEYGMADIVSFSQDMPWYTADKRVIVIADGEVQAGIDFDDGTTCDVSDVSSRRTITVVLPPAKVLSIDVNYRYFLDQGKLTPADRTWILINGKRQIRDKAIRLGVLAKAEANAVAFITAFVSALAPEARVSVVVKGNRALGSTPTPTPSFGSADLLPSS